MNRLTRRQIFRTAAVVPLAAVRGTAANSAISIGVIGCGNRGSFLAELLSEHTTARIAGLCDLSSERIERTRQRIGRSNVEAYSDLEKLLASTVDAVVIATPVFLHPDHFERAIQSGKHIYLEKPAAPDVPGSRRMERAAANITNRDLCFGFQRRYGEVYRAAAGLLATGKMGPLRMASARFIKSGPRPTAGPLPPPPAAFEEKVKSWSQWRVLSGDLIVENNCHLIDVLNWYLGGHPESASGEGGRMVRRPGDVRDHGNVSFEYAGGVQATLCGMTLAPEFHRDVREEFFSDAGWLETSENGWRYRLAPLPGAEERSPRNISIDSVQAFVRRIEKGTPENVIARGVESTLTAILGRLAMDLHRPVTWKELLAGTGWPDSHM